MASVGSDHFVVRLANGKHQAHRLPVGQQKFSDGRLVVDVRTFDLAIPRFARGELSSLYTKDLQRRSLWPAVSQMKRMKKGRSRRNKRKHL